MAYKAGADFTIGQSVVRLEDERLLRGEGGYLDDLNIENLAHGVVVRSPWPHANIVSIDASAARAAKGVLAVLTATEQLYDSIGPTWPHARENVHTGLAFPCEPQPILAVDRVRYVGEPVAFVVANTLADARDAAELVDVEYAPLDPVLTPKAARASAAPQISQQVPGNLHLDWDFGETARTQKALDGSAHVVTLDLHNHRIAHSAMEPRGAIGMFDAEAGLSGRGASASSADGQYRLHLSSQNVHVIRDHIASSLGVPNRQVHVTAPDVGGGFGVRNFVYGEYVMVAWAARVTGRPVKWVSTRNEGFASDHQARDFEARGELGFDADGRITALRIDADFNVGAYLIGAGGGVPTGQYCACPGTTYGIDDIHLRIRAVSTNTVPIGVTRGPGFAEMVDLMERMLDVAAKETGFDRLELRRRNLKSAADMPWTNSVGTVIDSGDFLGCFEKAIEQADIASFEARRDEAQARGRLRGIGVANHLKATGGLDEENIEFSFADNDLVLTTGTQAIGQGHETTFRQIVGSLLGVPHERIRYVAGDSNAIAMGGGHGSSRATYMAGTAMHFGALALLDKARPLAAMMLEASHDDIEFADGVFRVVGTDRNVTLLDVASFATERGVTLNTYYHFRRDAMTFPSGCHVAEVEVDIETGQCEVVTYTAVDDYGVLVNPVVASAQLQGATAQGIGQALLEEVVYDAESGQLLTGSFMDYAMPRATDVPSVDTQHVGTRCTTNPLGVKGCGEAGAIAGYPAIANAILDALREYDTRCLVGAATPARIWKLMHS
ncbi:MAG: carbon-monoxide dehydrogenase large subunit [Gammaproteobacteria bacterium]|jgi:carbon-monoxide dehydrogenase large subunit